MANTPIRAVRIPDGVWRPALARAESRGETLTDIVRCALTAYTEGAAICPPKDPGA